jgi:hypothetical protein
MIKSMMKELIGRTEENYYNQINLLKYGLEKNKNFIESLFLEEGLEGVEKNFTQKNNSKGEIQRKIDENMNLDIFLGKINNNCSPFFKITLENFDFVNIYYCSIFKENNIEHFLMINCEYNKNNFEIVERIYNQAFGVQLRNEKVDSELAKIYTSKKSYN